MDTTLLFGIAIIPAIVGLVQVAKDLGAPSNFAPAIAVVFGLLAGFAQFYAGQLPWISAAITGIALGLSAVGLYAGAKTVAANVSIAKKDTTIPQIVPISDTNAPHNP
jgi:hypothetical protein